MCELNEALKLCLKKYGDRGLTPEQIRKGYKLVKGVELPGNLKYLYGNVLHSLLTDLELASSVTHDAVPNIGELRKFLVHAINAVPKILEIFDAVQTEITKAAKASKN
ncbi:MAG: hypothetical protein HGB08_03370 [Candidatus Moranbacteria bacterium]|nr:hypothetical protein [Candidatus Moranbacteria bacterium]